MEITREDQLEEVDEVNVVVGDKPQETDIAEISFNAILGQSIDATMKFQGEINHRKVLTFCVQIGNGYIIWCKKVCSKSLNSIQDYYPFVIGGADLVFGINWLVSLNTTQPNWKICYKLQGMRSASSMGRLSP